MNCVSRAPAPSIFPSSHEQSIPQEIGGNPVHAHVPEFLFRLTRMLVDVSNHHLITWDEGRIVVFDPPRVESEVLSNYFRHSNYSSFQRQLNYFGFRKIFAGDKGSKISKMSPCYYVNNAATSDVSCLSLIRRRTAGQATERKLARSKSGKSQGKSFEGKRASSKSNNTNKHSYPTRMSKRAKLSAALSSVAEEEIAQESTKVIDSSSSESSRDTQPRKKMVFEEQNPLQTPSSSFESLSSHLLSAPSLSTQSPNTVASTDLSMSTFSPATEAANSLHKSSSNNWNSPKDLLSSFPSQPPLWEPEAPTFATPLPTPLAQEAVRRMLANPSSSSLFFEDDCNSIASYKGSSMLSPNSSLVDLAMLPEDAS